MTPEQAYKTTYNNAYGKNDGLFASLFRIGDSTARHSLQRILLLRVFFCLLCILGLIVFQLFSSLNLFSLQTYASLDISLWLVLGVVALLALSVTFGFWRIRRQRAVTTTELFAHLGLDVVFLLIVLVYTGGAGNPLISYLLVLLAIGATFLTRFYVNLFAVISILIYTVFILLDLQDNNDMESHGMVMDFQLHLVGMWVIFVVSAILISVFVTQMASAIRDRELTLAKAREKELRNEQLVAIGTLAAGTAHALGTPLSTMAVLLADLDDRKVDDLSDSDVKEDISVLRQQVLRCKESLNQLTRHYHDEGYNRDGSQSLDEFLADVKDYVVNIHPTALIDFSLEQEARKVQIPTDPNFRHAVINLIENAIRAASKQVQVTCRVGQAVPRCLEIAVSDDGPGIPTAVMESKGEPFISTRKDSMGLGIFLANAALEKIGGSIEMFNLKLGGALTLIKLPLPDQESATPITAGRVS
ncbi:MAG: ATP-binding protein [Pseudohongiellaceae bacterium]